MLLETFTSDELIKELIKRHEKTGNVHKLDLRKDDSFQISIKKINNKITTTTEYNDVMGEHDDGHIIIVKY